jgi:hypothetical protein
LCCFFRRNHEVNPSIRQSVNPSIRQSVNPSIRQSVNPSIRQVVVGLSAALFLGACNNNQPNAKLPSALAEAKPVHLIATEALGLSQAMSQGLSVQSASTIKLNHLLTTDILGQPYADMVFTTTSEVTNPLAYAVSIKDTNWSDVNDPNQSTTILGASTARTILMYQANNQRLLSELGKVVVAAGGVGNIKRVVSVAAADAFWVEDNAGNYWDSGSNTQVPAESVAKWRSEYTTLAQDISQGQQGNNIMRQRWEPILNPSNTNASAAALGIAAGQNPIRYFDNGQGRLDVAKFAKVVGSAKQDNQVNPQFNNGWNWCIWFLCVGVQEGGLSQDARRDLGGGYAQKLQDYYGPKVVDQYKAQNRDQFHTPPVGLPINIVLNLGYMLSSSAVMPSYNLNLRSVILGQLLKNQKVQNLGS